MSSKSSKSSKSQQSAKSAARDPGKSSQSTRGESAAESAKASRPPGATSDAIEGSVPMAGEHTRKPTGRAADHQRTAGLHGTQEDGESNPTDPAAGIDPTGSPFELYNPADPEAGQAATAEELDARERRQSGQRKSPGPVVPDSDRGSREQQVGPVEDSLAEPDDLPVIKATDPTGPADPR